MYNLNNPLFLTCETQLHAGTGSDLGIVDMPIQRERHTGFPKIESSTLKGCIRHSIKKQNGSGNTFINIAFGSENGNDNAGAIAFSDARLLCFPVKSLKDVFAWVTCPKILERFQKEMTWCNLEMPEIPTTNGGLICNNSPLKVSESINKLVLEEYAFEVAEDSRVTKLGDWFAEKIYGQNEYWSKKIKSNLVILSDEAFRDFVNLSTEINTRTKIDQDTGTVVTGGLFTEEYLPAESILYSVVMTGPEFSKDSNGKKDSEIRDWFGKAINQTKMIQIGGNATLGKGIVNTVFVN